MLYWNFYNTFKSSSIMPNEIIISKFIGYCGLTHFIYGMSSVSDNNFVIWGSIKAVNCTLWIFKSGNNIKICVPSQLQRLTTITFSWPRVCSSIPNKERSYTLWKWRSVNIRLALSFYGLVQFRNAIQTETIWVITNTNYIVTHDWNICYYYLH